MSGRNGMIHVAVLGCGMMGQEHASYMMANPRIRLKYIIDTSDESIKAFTKVVLGKQTPLRISEDDMVNHIHDIDLLVIATPNYLHTPALLRWGTYPITILVEKPVAVSLEQVRAIRKVKSEKGFQANIWVAMEYRYIPAIQKLIQMIPRVGPLKAVTIRENRYPFLSKVNEWNKDRNKSGDTLVEKCCHFFDLFRLLTRQEMSSCSTKIQRGLLKNYRYTSEADIPIIDSAYVLLDFQQSDEDAKFDVGTGHNEATVNMESKHSAEFTRSISPPIYEKEFLRARKTFTSDSGTSLSASIHSVESTDTSMPPQQGELQHNRRRLASDGSVDSQNIGPRESEPSVYEQEQRYMRDDQDQDGEEAVHPLSSLAISSNAGEDKVRTLSVGLNDVPIASQEAALQQATIGCLELCMFAEGSRHQEEIVVTGMQGRLEAYLPENKVFYYCRPDDMAWPDKSKPPPADSIKEEIFDCSELKSVYNFADELAGHAGYHYCSTAIEWKFLVDAILAARPPSEGGSGGAFVPHVSLEDGLVAVEMGIEAMHNIHNPVSSESRGAMKIIAPTSPGWGQLLRKQPIKRKNSAELLDRPLI